MLEDSFLFNAVVFVLGQVAAWGYLRTGLVRRGAALMIGGWMLADIALLARFAYAGGEAIAAAALAVMQAWSLVEVALLAYGRLRRRAPANRKRREELFREAFVCYLRNDLGGAGQRYRRLLRQDPWDLESVLGLASVMTRSGRIRTARGLLRHASSLDRERRWRDVISDELRRCVPRPKGSPAQRVKKAG